MTSKISQNHAKEVAQILLNSGCIIIRTKIPFKFTSGLLSPIYVDNRRLISLPTERKKIIKFFVAEINRLGKPDIIAGTATAGIPHAAWIADALNLPMVYVRSLPKDHGQKNQVEGIIMRGQKAIVIEDLVSTAGSSVTCIKALRKLGANVTDELAIYTHGLREADQNFKKLKVKFRPLTNLTFTVKIAQKEGFLRGDDQVKQILDWAKNPKNWGKKMGFA